MKPVTINMSELSESIELYESRPNRFFIYFIYLILGMFIIAFTWMYFWKIDIVVKSNGMFRGEDKVYEVSSNITGKIQSCNVTEGQLVKEGEVLLTVSGEELDNAIVNYQELQKDINQRIQILNAYSKSLEGNSEEFNNLTDNKYYNEFNNRKNLLEADIRLSGENIEEQKNQYQKDAESIRESINDCEERIRKYEQTKKGIINRNNSFELSDSYFYSIINSFISNYEATELQYNNQMKELQKAVDEADMKENTESIQEQIKLKEKEKEKVLSNLEIQEISGIEQQIETLNTRRITLKSELSAAEYKLAELNKSDTETAKNISIMKEKNNIAAELLTYEGKKEECETALKSYNYKSGNCNITANQTGYVSFGTEVREGGYIQEGTILCRILPETNSGYYAELYVENGDIAKLQKGQTVKFEIAAYPSSEYGYFTGMIDTIAKDIKVDSNSGVSYYPVRVKCEKTTVMNRHGDKGTIMNGMICQAKIIVGEKSVFRYLMEKINLLDK